MSIDFTLLPMVTEVSDEQPKNVFSSILSTASGIEMERSDEHPQKAELPMVFTPLGMLMDSKLLQSLKMPSLRLLRLLDSVTVFKFEHHLNALKSMSVTLSGITKLVRFLHLANAATPICVTLAGISISVIGQALKAQPSIIVIFWGISTDVKGHD